MMDLVGPKRANRRDGYVFHRYCGCLKKKSVGRRQFKQRNCSFLDVDHPADRLLQIKSFRWRKSVSPFLPSYHEHIVAILDLSKILLLR
jgi:hypothetical protein